MGRIVHLSLKVDEVEKTGEFYKSVFGFQDSETKKTRDHVSRHMTDGEIDFTLMKYDAGTQSAESKTSARCARAFAPGRRCGCVRNLSWDTKLFRLHPALW